MPHAGAQVRFRKHRGIHGDEPIELRRAFRQLAYGPDERGLVQFHRLRTLRKNLPQIGEVCVLQLLPPDGGASSTAIAGRNTLRYPSSSHTRSTRRRVSSLMENDGSFSKRDTVLCDIPGPFRDLLERGHDILPANFSKGFYYSITRDLQDDGFSYSGNDLQLINFKRPDKGAMHRGRACH